MFRETFHQSFKNAFDLILDISSNLERPEDNFLCKKKFLDFGAGKHILLLLMCFFSKEIFCFVHSLPAHTNLRKYVGLNSEKIIVKKEKH